MAATESPYSAQKQTEAITAHVLWMTTGLSCEGDSVAMTSATNPSLEDIIQGVIPGMPRVVIHNQVVAFETGDDVATLPVIPCLAAGDAAGGRVIGGEIGIPGIAERIVDIVVAVATAPEHADVETAPVIDRRRVCRSLRISGQVRTERR